MNELAQPVRLLHLEDSARDAALIGDLLGAGGMNCQIVRADNRCSFQETLETGIFDLILCDYNLPDYDGLTALQFARAKQPAVPVIILSGSVEDEEAVRCLQLGATDYLLKGRLERFVPAVRRALKEAADRQQQTRAEAELRESEQRYREIVQSSPDIIALVRQGKIDFMNDAGFRLLRGGAGPPIIGREVVSLFHPADQEPAVQRQAWLAECPRTAPMAEARLVAGDGSVLNVEVRALSFMSANELVIQMICRDISERKRAEDALRTSEEQFRQLAETIEDAFWITTHEARELLYISPGYEQIWGRAAADLYARPRDWTESIVPEDRPAVFEGLRALHEGRGLDIEFRIQRPDGTIRFIHDRGFAIRGEDGEVRRAVGVARDITMRKEAEAAVQQRTQELERFHRLSVGRELRMVELKREINRLAVQSGRSEPYDLAFAAGADSQPEELP